MNKTSKRPQSEFRLNKIEIGQRLRGNLQHYYAEGGDKTAHGIFQGWVIEKKNGWTLLKYLTIRFREMDINYIFHDVVGIEDHIWVVDEDVYNNCEIGDYIEFTGKAYAYRRRTARVKQEGEIDFSLKDIENIRKIERYNYPPEDMEQSEQEDIQRWEDELICEMCMYSSQCYHNGICLAPDGWFEKMHKIMDTIINTEKCQSKTKFEKLLSSMWEDDNITRKTK